MNYRAAARVVMPALLLAVAACGSNTPAQPATRMLQSITISGLPGGFFVNERAALTARATYSDGTSDIVTSRVRWSTKTLTCVVDATGQLTALALGPCIVEASLDGAVGMASVAIGAARVFTIRGTVREKFGVDQPRMPGVPVVLASGAQEGRRVLTDATGQFVIADVPRETVGVRVEAAGYAIETTSVDPQNPDVLLLVSPVFETIARRFSSAEAQAENFRGFDTILTVAHWGPARLFASTTGSECFTAFDTYTVLLTEENGQALTPFLCGGPNGGTIDTTVMLEPGRYRFRVSVTSYPPGRIREYHLSYPK